MNTSPSSLYQKPKIQLNEKHFIRKPKATTHRQSKSITSQNDSEKTLNSPKLEITETIKFPRVEQSPETNQQLVLKPTIKRRLQRSKTQPKKKPKQAQEDQPLNCDEAEFRIRLDVFLEDFPDPIPSSDIIKLFLSLIDQTRLRAIPKKLQIFVKHLEILQMTAMSLKAFEQRVLKWYQSQRPELLRIHQIKKITPNNFILLQMTLLRDYEILSQNSRNPKKYRKKIAELKQNIQNSLTDRNTKSATLSRARDQINEIIKCLMGNDRGSKEVTEFYIKQLGMLRNNKRPKTLKILLKSKTGLNLNNEKLASYSPKNKEIIDLEQKKVDLRVVGNLESRGQIMGTHTPQCIKQTSSSQISQMNIKKSSLDSLSKLLKILRILQKLQSEEKMDQISGFLHQAQKQRMMLFQKWQNGSEQPLNGNFLGENICISKIRKETFLVRRLKYLVKSMVQTLEQKGDPAQIEKQIAKNQKELLQFWYLELLQQKPVSYSDKPIISDSKNKNTSQRTKKTKDTYQKPQKQATIPESNEQMCQLQIETLQKSRCSIKSRLNNDLLVKNTDKNIISRQTEQAKTQQLGSLHQSKKSQQQTLDVLDTIQEERSIFTQDSVIRESLDQEDNQQSDSNHSRSKNLPHQNQSTQINSELDFKQSLKASQTLKHLNLSFSNSIDSALFVDNLQFQPEGIFVSDLQMIPLYSSSYIHQKYSPIPYHFNDSNLLNYSNLSQILLDEQLSKRQSNLSVNHLNESSITTHAPTRADLEIFNNTGLSTISEKFQTTTDLFQKIQKKFSLTKETSNHSVVSILPEKKDTLDRFSRPRQPTLGIKKQEESSVSILNTETNTSNIRIHQSEDFKKPTKSIESTIKLPVSFQQPKSDKQQTIEFSNIISNSRYHDSKSSIEKLLCIEPTPRPSLDDQEPKRLSLPLFSRGLSQEARDSAKNGQKTNLRFFNKSKTRFSDKISLSSPKFNPAQYSQLLQQSFVDSSNSSYGRMPMSYFRQVIQRIHQFRFMRKNSNLSPAKIQGALTYYYKLLEYITTGKIEKSLQVDKLIENWFLSDSDELQSELKAVLLCGEKPKNKHDEIMCMVYCQYAAENGLLGRDSFLQCCKDHKLTRRIATHTFATLFDSHTNSQGKLNLSSFKIILGMIALNNFGVDQESGEKQLCEILHRNMGGAFLANRPKIDFLERSINDRSLSKNRLLHGDKPFWRSISHR